MLRCTGKIIPLFCRPQFSIKAQYAIGLGYKDMLVSLLLQIFLCTGFFSERPLSNNSPAQIVTQCYYIPDVELWICLCWNSLQFFAKSCFRQRWEKIYEKQSWRKKTNIKENALKGRREEWRLRKKIKKWKSATAIKYVCFYVAFTFKNVSDLRNKEKILCYISNTIILFGMAE